MKRMQHRVFLWIGVVVLSLNFAALAQAPPQLQEQLQRLRRQLNQIQYFLQIIDRAGAGGALQQRLEVAWQEWHKARQLMNQRKFALARMHLQAVREMIGALQQFIRDHPYFRFRYKQDLDRRIQEAEQQAQQTDEPQVFRFINQAKFFRHKAIQALHQNRLTQSIEYYRLALFFVKAALRIIHGSPDQGPADFHKLENEAEEVLNRIEFLQKQREVKVTAEELRRWRQNLRQAQQMFASGQRREATTRLQALLHLLYSRLQVSPVASPAGRLQRQLQLARRNFLNLREREQGRVPYQKVALRRVERLLQEVQTLMEQGRYRQAESRLLVVNRLIYQLQRTFPDQPITNLEQRIQQTYQNLEQLRQDLAELPGSDRLFGLVQHALDQARQMQKAGRLELAVRYLSLANQMITKFYHLTTVPRSQKVNREQFEKEYRRARTLLQEVSQKSTGEKFQVASRLSEQILEVADAYAQQARYGEAYELVQFALNLLTKINR